MGAATTTAKPTGLALLREPFPKEAVGKLPRVTCNDCSNKRCQQHKKQKCQVCDAYISTSHIHLDFVGHALVTDRLLTVDPQWNWEPLAFTDDGLPKFVVNDKNNPVGFWIKLTVLGVTRLGYGSTEAGKAEAVKELIGDALRNAAMRFGVALDLWSKSELESQIDEDKPQDRGAGASTRKGGDVGERSDKPRPAPEGVPDTRPAPTRPSSLREAQQRMAAVNQKHQPPADGGGTDVKQLITKQSGLDQHQRLWLTQRLVDEQLPLLKTSRDQLTAAQAKQYAALIELAAQEQEEVVNVRDEPFFADDDKEQAHG